MPDNMASVDDSLYRYLVAGAVLVICSPHLSISTPEGHLSALKVIHQA